MVLTSCALGERPTLEEPDTSVTLPSTDVTDPVGGAPGSASAVPAADSLLSVLEGSEPDVYTATYDVTRNVGDVTKNAVVGKRGDNRSVTVGAVRLLEGW